MGNYINSNLVKGERVVYEAHYHWTVWVVPILAFLILTVPVILVYSTANNYNDTYYYDDYSYSYRSEPSIPAFIWIFPLIGVSILILTFAKVVTDEFAVTTQRLIIKTGVISRTTLELNLLKVETVSVSQGILDRIFGGGTLECRGTGSTRSRIANISEPYEFRRAFQDALDRYSNDEVEEETPSATAVRDSSAQMTSHAASTASTMNSEMAQKLYQLKELLDSGILTQEEFDVEKSCILNSH